MEISEEITNEHYLFLREQHALPNPDMRPVNYLEGVAFLAGIMIFAANITKEWDAALIGFGGLGIFIIVKILGALLTKKTFIAWQQDLKGSNLGKGTWRLDETSLYFTGVEYDAVLPYDRIKNVSRSDKGAFLMLSDSTGFILPFQAAGKERHYDTFFAKLDEHISASAG